LHVFLFYFLVVKQKVSRLRLISLFKNPVSDREEVMLPALALFEFSRGRAASLLLRPQELQWLHPTSTAVAKAAPPSSIEGRWLQLREKWKRDSTAIEELLKLEGLTKVFALVFILFDVVRLFIIISDALKSSSMFFC